MGTNKNINKIARMLNENIREDNGMSANEDHGTDRNPLASLIKRICDANDEYWDGSLWRSSTGSHIGSYYHIKRKGAAFYSAIPDAGDPVEYKCPNGQNPLLIDFSTWAGTDLIAKWSGKTRQELIREGTVIEWIDKLIPDFEEAGYDCLVIFGESGRDVRGFPLEVVTLGQMKHNMTPAAST